MRTFSNVPSSPPKNVTLASRTVLALAAGIATITVLRSLSDHALMNVLPDAFSDGITQNPSLLILMLAYTLMYALFGGYITAKIAGRAAAKHSLALAMLQLSLGIVLTAESFERVPLWWHVCYLVLLAPAILLGGQMRAIRERNIDASQRRIEPLARSWTGGVKTKDDRIRS